MLSKSKKLMIFVVGEAVRWDHLSLNGYEKQTNPLLTQQEIINFNNFFSCGTSTAISVPCMFSIYNRNNFSWEKAYYTQNVLDILNKAGVKILWRDNNSDSKGVALRINYQDFKSNRLNKICDIECRDEGMLIGLDKFIDSKNTLIILHQMGNHGPAYYKRYPKKYEVFKPICKTNELQQCTQSQISNAYDNALVYTDYFLNKVIEFLKQYNDYEAILFYVSDHGESLGENGIYLHGMPYFIAPQYQKHIGALIWMNKKAKQLYKQKLDKIKNKKLFQEIVFHSLLGFFNVNSKAYDKSKDIFR
jgi:lipid A ethanolaminephosphotransferase